LSQTGILELRNVVIIKIIDPDDLLATYQQLPGDMHADKTGNTGD
jgi:hypothetical protein